MIFEYIVERLFGWLSGLKNEYAKNCKSLIFVCIKMKNIVQKMRLWVKIYVYLSWKLEDVFDLKVAKDESFIGLL